jgi:hypothetical protein
MAGQADPQQAGPARGLSAQQRQQTQRAAQRGNLDQYLQRHQGVAQHMQKVAQPGAPQGMGQFAQNVQAKNTAAQQKLQATQRPAPMGAPAAGASGQKGAGAPPAAAPAAAPAGAPAAGAGGGKAGAQPATTPPTFNEAFNKQFGTGAANQFQQDWYGGNPLTTAMDAAKRATGERLADVRNRYAQSGFGMSGREALAEGQAIGDVNTNLGAQLAQLGTQVRGSDLDRLNQMFATAGQQQLQERLGMGQLGLQANQQLANLGTGVTGIGAQEQGIPNMENIVAMLANMSQQPTFSQGAQKQPSK